MGINGQLKVSNPIHTEIMVEMQNDNLLFKRRHFDEDFMMNIIHTAPSLNTEKVLK